MTSENSFLLSILVPTRNRTNYAIETAKQVLSIPDKRIQLVIQDNSDTNELQEVLSGFSNDRRLKYRYIRAQLSFVDNFSKAVENSDGYYLCAIGDDDGVNPTIMQVVQWAKDHSVPSVQYKLKAVYVWPDSGIYKNSRIKDNGRLIVGKASCNVSETDPKEELKKLLSNGCQNYLKLSLTKLYHGIVKKECLEELKTRTGAFFNGLSPDIYSAVALSLVVKKNVVIDYPLTISGICKASGSADAATGKHTGKWEDAPHFKGHKNYRWSPEVPKIYSVETIWADSALMALNHFKEGSQKFNRAALSAYCLVKHSQYSKILAQHYFGTTSKIKLAYYIKCFNLCLYVVKGPIADLAGRVFKKIVRKKTDFTKISKLQTIGHAQKKLSNVMSERHIDIETVLVNLKGIEKNE